MTEFMKNNLELMLVLFDSKKEIKYREICEYLGVSLATGKNYINILREQGHNIESIKGRNGYLYLK